MAETIRSVAETRRFYLQRDIDRSSISGTGRVADGVVFPDGTVALRWRGEWPTSTVIHERGLAAVRHIHGHGGDTQIIFLDKE